MPEAVLSAYSLTLTSPSELGTMISLISHVSQVKKECLSNLCWTQPDRCWAGFLEGIFNTLVLLDCDEQSPSAALLSGFQGFLYKCRTVLGFPHMLRIILDSGNFKNKT
jgi:hypothetical protein